mmetsp:Transcript_15677/g.28731  ORF Transcript_15677/g.28731 Transcript_15677/m.28731 type:complete len:94 (-) Transcript_15677:383-664(-)
MRTWDALGDLRNQLNGALKRIGKVPARCPPKEVYRYMIQLAAEKSIRLESSRATRAKIDAVRKAFDYVSALPPTQRLDWALVKQVHYVVGGRF